VTTQLAGVTQYIEVTTATGEIVHLSVPPEDTDTIKKLLARASSLNTPFDHPVNVQHGGFGRYSRYQINQLEYAATDGEDGGYVYIELLVITNPPEGRCGIVIHESGSHLMGGSVFTEWETLEDATRAFTAMLGVWYRDREITTPGLWGYIRTVHCGLLTPWFYAIGSQELHGDYARAPGLEDDPVFVAGKEFVVFDQYGSPSVKTCMGCRIREYRQVQRNYMGYRQSDGQVISYRLVAWNDGSMWDERDTNVQAPRPLEAGEAWITEAIGKFCRLIAGTDRAFTIHFTNGGRFEGKFLPKNPKSRSAEGRYSVSIKLKDGTTKEGWVDFVPTTELPTLMDFIKAKLKVSSYNEIDTLAVTHFKAASGKSSGKKWAGLFYSPSQQHND
jgi:hypothetical protein